MTTIVYKKSYSTPPIDKIEALRYAGVRGDAPEISALLDECISEAMAHLSYKLCYAYYPISRDGGRLNLGFAEVCSDRLAAHLAECDGIILLAATLGVPFDRLIAKQSKTSPTKALLLDGLGTERIEALCDLFCREEEEKRAKSGETLTSRFSAGYGDLPLEMQKSIFKALDCEKNIGLTLGDSLLMSPQKSVTAIIGIKKVKK
jgi:hypothetical protein